MVCDAEAHGRSRDEEFDNGSDHEQDPDEGFDEEPDETDLTPPPMKQYASAGPGDEDEADEGFDEEPDWSERGDDGNREER
jgi:hypothetical protein